LHFRYLHDGAKNLLTVGRCAGGKRALRQARSCDWFLDLIQSEADEAKRQDVFEVFELGVAVEG
jgi:hypothetical protein